jgi:hypothetical protein
VHSPNKVRRGARKPFDHKKAGKIPLYVQRYFDTRPLRRHRMRWFGLIFLTTSLAACSAIERKTELALSASPGQTMAAGPGDTVLDFKVTKSLPNAFGKADIFGRTADAGRIVVRYIKTENGQAIFERRDLIIESNKTTMTETPLVIPNTSTTVMNGYNGSRPVSGTATTTSYDVVGPRPTNSFAMNTAPIVIAVTPGETLAAEGHVLRLISAGNNSISYSIQ